jgi:hypothetical protein
MEGNLSRAKSNLIVSSPSANSFASDNSTPSPPIQLRSSAILKDSSGNSSPYSPGHARMGSDNALKIGIPVNVYPPRSASALGAAGGYRQPLTVSRSVDQIREQLTGAYGSSRFKGDTLEPLSEDDTLQSQDAEGGGANKRTSAQLESFLSPTFGGPGDKGIQRSASVNQMRDIKVQVKDLKGKISTLREQARADSLKRRSLQSLRTPSPFTNARVDQWYSGNRFSGSEAAENTGRNPWNGEMSSVDGEEPKAGDEDRGDPDDEESIISGYEDATNGETALGTPPVQQFVESPVLPIESRGTGAASQEDDDMDDMQTENGDVEDEDREAVVEEVLDDEAYESESAESLYHDTLQHPVSHEDREDAFDYEHFILHSALGTIRHGRSDSFSSEDSVETTRGPIVEARKNRSSVIRRSRRGSAASASTVESFATATEGRASRSTRDSSGSDGSAKDCPPQTVSVPESAEPATPQTARRAEFVPSANGNPKRSSVEEPRQTQQPPVARRPASSAAMLHRPSVSSFESTGTNRSFPLVSKRPLAAVLTPNTSASSSDEELKSISETLMNETASIFEAESVPPASRSASVLAGYNENTPATMQMLQKEDHYLVERLVAALGKCVLGLSDSGKASVESRMYRRRIDAARRLLEGLDHPV